VDKYQVAVPLVEGDAGADVEIGADAGAAVKIDAGAAAKSETANRI
jgi:hypothetical protein